MKKVFLSEEILVKDVMSSPIIELDVSDTALKAAQYMAKYNISSIVVMRNSVPVGIVTKRDLVEKVVAQDRLPSEIKLESIMSSPLHTIGPDETIEEAVRRMNRLNVSRLVVLYKGEVHGVVSMKDVLKVTPEIIEIIKEHYMIKGSAKPLEPLLEGFCDSCGEWSDMLKRVEDQYLCEECSLELEKSRT
ncbi:MAG: CBS domain-containing protein [Aigarchaeota archaeon]|nr:CBS domain-containing protein [Aigarchaeota archaeon]MDW8093126.1 CBS domain-containing protein [Nitrososphaerota archaeon]